MGRSAAPGAEIPLTRLADLVILQIPHASPISPPSIRDSLHSYQPAPHLSRPSPTGTGECLNPSSVSQVLLLVRSVSIAQNKETDSPQLFHTGALACASQHAHAYTQHESMSSAPMSAAQHHRLQSTAALPLFTQICASKQRKPPWPQKLRVEPIQVPRAAPPFRTSPVVFKFTCLPRLLFGTRCTLGRTARACCSQPLAVLGADKEEGRSNREALENLPTLGTADRLFKH